MSSVEYNRRTAEAIRKADSLSEDLTTGRKVQSTNIVTHNDAINYGNTYIMKILSFMGNGLYEASVVNADGTISNDKYIIATLDMMVGDTYLVNDLVQVTEANIQYASYIAGNY